MKKSVQTFFKQNAFYLILAFVICVGTVIGALVITNSNKKSTGVFNEVENSSSTTPASSSSKKDDPTPAPTVIKFIMPVANGEIFNAFTENSVTFNKTLGIYTGHMGIDIKGEENANVLCCYDGKIEKIETNYLYGTVITVNHGSNLYSVYSSLEADDTLTVGQQLKQGDILGKISTTNKQEYKDGAHLHFEVLENGAKINPDKYLND